ncbi:MAG: ATP-binding protein [bacterium]|nr:ATP-binding protein [bacterium]
MIARQLEKTIKDSLRPGFINVIYGPRRVGKTVLLEKLIADNPTGKTLFINGDTQEGRDALSSTSEVTLSKLVEKFSILAVDEAQRIPNIGLALKIIVDKFPDKTIYSTGSSSLMLARGIKEPLTGRSLKYKLYPLSTSEMTQDIPDFEKISVLENQLIYGGYPYLEQLSSRDDKKNYLKSIIDDYLFKDVNLLREIESPETLKKLATLLAFQIGSIVSLNELSRNLGIDVKTVARYISLLKQSFVIFEIGSFSRNARKELAKSKKYYFWDTGIRNALSGQFSDTGVRSDIGQLWENFLAVERLKKDEYSKTPKGYFFWRNYEKAEIDWIETSEEDINAFEFKWQIKKTHTPKAFKDAYKKDLEIVSKENYLEFVS